MTEQGEPGVQPELQEEPGGGAGPQNPATEGGGERPPVPSLPKPKVEVKTRRLPAAFYVGAGVATMGVLVMLWAAWRREP